MASYRQRRLAISVVPKELHWKTNNWVFTIESKTFEFRECTVNADFFLEIAEKAPYSIRTIFILVFIPIRACRWLKERVSKAIKGKSILQPSWVSGDGTSKLEVRIITNQRGCFLRIPKLLPDHGSISICIPEGFSSEGWRSFQHFIP